MTSQGAPAFSLPPRIVVHVGMEKAASTTVQNVLHARRAELLAEGVLFPDSVFTRKVENDPARTSGHLELLRLLDGGDLSAFAAELEEAGAGTGTGAHTLLLSAENLFHHPDDAALARLGALLAGREVVVIAVLRRQPGWLLSYYNESVANGWNADCRSIDRFARDMIVDGRLDYAARLDRLEALLSPARIVALDYDRLAQSPRGVLEAVTAAAGLKLPLGPGGRTPRDHVTRTNAPALEAHRLLNLLAGGFWSREMHRWAAAMRAHADRVVTARGLPHDRALPDPETRRRLLDHVRAPNRRLSLRYLDGADFAADEGWAEAPAPVPDPALVQELWRDGLELFLDEAARAPSLRAKPERARQFPLPLLMGAEETRAWAAALRAARVVLVHGDGAEVLMAASQFDKLVFCVSDSAGWGLDLQYELDRLDLPSTPLVHRPPAGAAAYAGDIWEQPFFRAPDLVLIDGAHRGACLRAAQQRCRRPVTVLVAGAEEAAKGPDWPAGLPAPRARHASLWEYRLEPGAG